MNIGLIGMPNSGKTTNLLQMEEKLLHRIIDHLSSDQPIRDLKLDGTHEKMIRGFQFLTQKPMMVIVNSDLARGFIRAECISYDDLMAYGSEKQVSEKGLLRLEGKKYVVEDGNILNIRFNI